MDHTYLRYECADSFGLTVAAGSSKAPSTSRILAVVNSANHLLTTTGSCVTCLSLKSGQPLWKWGHRSTGIGTGRALNSDEVVCLDAVIDNTTLKVATGWVDGTVRIFDVLDDGNNSEKVVAHSLLEDPSDFLQRESLVLKGHDNPVRIVVFDKAARLASAGSNGTIILWDVVAESGLFRLVGHRAGITDLSFVDEFVISCSLDGLVKVWDLSAQCCTQTIASHHGPVGAGVCRKLFDDERWRLVTGGNDGQVRVWSVNTENKSDDDLCEFMGTLIPPPNVAISNEKVSCIQFHGRLVGILHTNSKNVDIYLARSTQESLKKLQRRLKRRQEKQKKSAEETSIGPKRGLLDDPDDEKDAELGLEEQVDPERIKASDEFEYVATMRATHKLRSFAFVPKEKGEIGRLVCALSTNALETHSLIRKAEGVAQVVIAEKIATFDFYGHPTGIRSIALSSDDRLACTVSKNVTKVWNVASRSCIQSLSPEVEGKACYGLCAVFMPGNTHVAIGTREGHLLLVDICAGEVVYAEEGAHDGAIWDIDLRRQSSEESSIFLVTGSADKSVKFWSIEAQDEDTDVASGGQPMFVQTRTLQMTDDVVAVGYSKTVESTKRFVFVSTLDSTIKVFFDDLLKMFLSLYGHKLPALSMDCSDDDVLLASGGADKTVKIWGLDFGDTHRTLHGHDDSITDLRFVRRTHNFFTSSKDGTVRYWDGDRFEQILLFNGHFAEVNCLAVSRNGAFVLSGSMDRQVRVWERTKDIVFLEEERERELEQIFDREGARNEGGTAQILDRKRGQDDDDEEEEEDEEQPQSEAAVKRSILSAQAGDRIMEALERADQELKEIAAFRKVQGAEKARAPNMMMLGLEPAPYVFYVLKTVKSAELEQSLIVLPLRHIERLAYYIVVLLRGGRSVELCSRIAVFMVKTHQNQIIATKSMAPLIRELKRLTRQRLSVARDVVGYDLAAMKLIARAANEKKQSLTAEQLKTKDIWADLGLGSDVAAALEGRSKKKNR